MARAVGREAGVAMGPPQVWADCVERKPPRSQGERGGAGEEGKGSGESPSGLPSFPRHSSRCLSLNFPNTVLMRLFRPKLASTVQQAESLRVLGRANIPFPGPVDEPVYLDRKLCGAAVDWA